jgi:hypothetical protein
MISSIAWQKAKKIGQDESPDWTRSRLFWINSANPGLSVEEDSLADPSQRPLASEASIPNRARPSHPHSLLSYRQSKR